MKQIITNRIQTTISVTQGDSNVFIQTNHDSPSVIQVNTNGINIQIQTGVVILQPPTYDSYEEVKPKVIPGPIATLPDTQPLKLGLNFWPFKKSPKKVSELPIQTTEFVRVALKWCEENIEKTKRSYTYELKYYKPKRMMGTYSYASRKITVYVYPSLGLKSLCNTLIHEYAHHLHIKTKADQNEYDRLSRMHTYWNNPHEKLSRAYEAKFGAELWEYMNRCFLIKY
jgi:hypothetical protein